MSTKTKENLTVVSQEEIGKDIFSLWLQTDQMAQYARPGQFLSLYTGNSSKLLPRPISICEIDKETSRIRLVYRVTGKNTGTEGNVLNAIQEKALEADVIFACGPTPMLRALKEYAAANHITCWISMEERMACGIGACLACVCKSKDIDAHSQVHNKRVCKDGPVFLSTEVEL